MQPFLPHPFAPIGFDPFIGLDALSMTFFVLVIIWSIAWKGLALWHAARNEQKWWFIVILIINTAGFLEIIYLFCFRADREVNPLSRHFARPTPSSAHTDTSPAASDTSLPVAESSPAESSEEE